MELSGKTLVIANCSLNLPSTKTVRLLTVSVLKSIRKTWRNGNGVDVVDEGTSFKDQRFYIV